ncbi:hypothetical protein [Halobacteriovorax sp. CON-3]|uniref:hypothetical protein n=1 Tax=Halobacteriovorax sp. CON-3 TaxID=3157710 RepID=UPI00371DFEAE
MNGSNDDKLNESRVSQKLEVVDRFLQNGNLTDAEKLQAELVALNLKQRLEDINTKKKQETSEREEKNFNGYIFLAAAACCIYCMRSILFY